MNMRKVSLYEIIMRIFSKAFICGSSSSNHDFTSSNTVLKTLPQSRIFNESTYSTSTIRVINENSNESSSFASARRRFEASYPQYRSPLLDEFRAHEYTRLGNTVYLDYTGASLYPECLIHEVNYHLTTKVLGNPHSSNPASQTSSTYTALARQAVLNFFGADPEIYSVVWTANATGAAKIVGESYPWQANSTLLLPSDAHNAINGLRRFAQNKGSRVKYYTLDKQITVSQPDVVEPGLFCLTGQSNVSGFQGNLALISQAASLGYHTLLDAAALAPTTPISLSGSVLENNVDAMIISLYKIIGYPTGLGALVIKKEFLRFLQKPWFSGGTVDIVQVPGDIYTLEEGFARFEDGTINFLSLSTVPEGLSLVSKLQPQVKSRILSLTHWMMHSLAEIRHPATGTQLVHIRSPPLHLSYQTLSRHYGATIALEVADADGNFISCDAIEYAAGKADICIRAGCMCNPGGAVCIMNTPFMDYITKDDTKQSLEEKFGVRSRGVVRVSFGIASDFSDAWRFVEFMRSLTGPMKLSTWDAEWRKLRAHAHAFNH